jgi:DNA-binding PadR family transcriptional regulator
MTVPTTGLYLKEKNMKLITRLSIVAVLFTVFAAGSVFAESNGGPRTSQAYYKITAGHQEEWVKLYKTYHYPILKALKEQGYIQSITLLKRDRHHLVPAWDFELQIVWRDKVAQVTGDSPELLHRLFPDWDDYQKAKPAAGK